MSETFDVTNPLANILPQNNVPAYIPPGSTDNPIAAQPAVQAAQAAAQTAASTPAAPVTPGIPTVGTGMTNPIAPTAPRPASFAAKLLSAVGSVLQSANEIGVRGFAEGGNPQARDIIAKQQEQQRYNAEQARLAQERQDKLTQEQRTQQREDDEAHARIANMNVQNLATTQQSYRMGVDWQNKQVAEESQHLKDIIGDGIHSPVQSGVTGDQLNQLLQDNKLNPYEYSYFKTGLKDTGQKDSAGNPKYDYTYDVLKVPNSMPLTDDMIARIKTVPGYENLQKGTVMSGSQILGALQQAKMIETSEEATRKQLADAGIERSKEDQAASELELVKSGDWIKALNANGGSAVNAAASILHDPAMAKKYGGALYNDVMYQFHAGKDDVGTENYITALNKQKEIDEKAKADQDKKDQALSFQGDPTLAGEPFLNSLKDSREKALVREAGDGRMNATNLAALMRGKNGPEFAEAVAQYAPDFQADKVVAYYDAVKKYNDDSAGSVGGQLQAAGTALRGLRQLYDATNKEAILFPLGQTEKARQTYLGTVPNEVAKFNAAGRQPGEKDIADIKKKLGDSPNPIYRRQGIESQAELVAQKIAEMEDDWDQKAPSPKYQTPMPTISPTARIDAAYILNKGSLANSDNISNAFTKGKGGYIIPRGAQPFMNPKTGHETYTFDGKTYFDSSTGLPMPTGAK